MLATTENGMLKRLGRCPKCQGSMQEGFIPDHSHGAVLLTSWVEGEPVKNFFGSVKQRGRTTKPITASRCSVCGFLELYAV
jgi:hypothetical protein